MGILRGEGRATGFERDMFFLYGIQGGGEKQSSKVMSTIIYSFSLSLSLFLEGNKK